MNTTQSLDHDLILVVDLEATCCDQGTIPVTEMEIIEIGAVVARADGTVLASFERRVRPVLHTKLTRFCTSLTGIEQQDVDDAETLPDVLVAMSEWLQVVAPAGVMQWASWGAYDLRQFQQDLLRHGIAGCLPDQHVNLKKLFAKRWHLKKRPALSTALALAALQFDGRPHHALDDARNAARLLPEVLPLISK